MMKYRYDDCNLGLSQFMHIQASWATKSFAGGANTKILIAQSNKLMFNIVVSVLVTV